MYSDLVRWPDQLAWVPIKDIDIYNLKTSSVVKKIGPSNVTVDIQKGGESVRDA